MAAAAPEAAIRALLSAVSGLDEDVVEYLVGGLLESAEDEDSVTADTVRDVIGPFLEEQEVDDAVVGELSDQIAALFAGGGTTPLPEPEPEPEPDARAEAQTAQSSRRAKLAGEERPLTPQGEGRLASAVRIGATKAASVDISVRASSTRSDGSSAVNKLIKVADGDADDDTPLALAASSTSGAASRKAGKKGRRGGATSSKSRAGGGKKDSALRMRPLVLPLQRLALCAGAAHTRLGADSPLASLSDDLIKEIVQHFPQRVAKKTLEKVLAGERWAWMVFQIPSLASPDVEGLREMAAAGTLEAQLVQQQMTRDGQVEADDLDDLAAAWKLAGETGQKWGGRGFGGRGWLRNGQTENAKDIILYNLSLSYAGKVLLKMVAGGAGLSAGQTFKLMRGHRYGMLGNNGCGKTTLLRRISTGSLPGFPRHLRTLLVDQELAGGERNAVDEVVASDTRVSELREQAAELEALLDGEGEGEEEEEFTDDERMELMDRLAEVLEQIDEADDGSAEQTKTRARKALVGLGFTPELLERSTSQLSGGWRMRVALAKALFMKPDVLMLDEPTNHLDLQAVGWLEDELCKLEGTDTITMIVSHDRAFLAATASDIVEFSNQTLRQFAMDFDTYIETKRARAAKMAKEMDNLEKKRQHAIDVANKLEKAASGTADDRLLKLPWRCTQRLDRGLVSQKLNAFASRWMCHDCFVAGKKGDQKKSKQVAKVRKQVITMGFSQNADGQNLTKLKLSETGERAGSITAAYGKQTNQMGQGGGRLNLASVAKAMNDGISGGETPFRVQFKTPPRLSQPNMPVLQLRELSFRWPGQSIDLWSDVTMTAHMGQRIALLGANGQGKSTLVDVMRGVLSPRVGELRLGHGVGFSHYSQHSAATLPPEATPLEYLASLFPHNTEMELRAVLGSYNVRGNLATQTRCGQLSGGQKARVVFAAAAHASPHILFLDEPTNHLDMTTIAYLSEAISTFEGVVVLVSHNRDLIISLGPVRMSHAAPYTVPCRIQRLTAACAGYEATRCNGGPFGVDGHSS